jgi:predicted flap endonuclease-1-like 5' DNA nuclease
MTNPVHLLTVASLLLVAFLVGAVLGTLARLVALRLTRKPASAPPAVVEPAPAPAPLVAAPVIAPLPVAPAPTAPPPAEVPVPDFAATLIALAEEAPPPSFLEVVRPPEPAAPPPPTMQPARVAGETTSGRRVPRHLEPPRTRRAPSTADQQHSADVIPFPSATAEEVRLEQGATLASQTAQTRVLAPAEYPPPPEPVSPAQEPAPAPSQPVDEDAAMRAIEGNWTPRRRPAPIARPAPVPPPEGVNQAVAASARAVAAARRSAEAAVAEAALDSGRPQGLETPHEGGKDDLTHIIGVLPVIETALNRLGIYHFDQVAAISDENVGWIEGHLGIPGRIGRELWREQARELSAVLKPRRAAEN